MRLQDQESPLMLKFHEGNGTFILFTNENARAEAAGLTLSTTTRGPNGERVFFTADHNKKPEYNPYAVLEFFDEADETARGKLISLKRDYEFSWSDNHSVYIPAPKGKTYMDYQRAGIAYCMSHGNSVIADEPGLGKTIQAIGYANVIGARRILVLCPASIRRQWAREIQEWSTLDTRPSIRVINTGRDGVSTARDTNFVICSYDLARNTETHTALCAIEWDLIICDESHYLKTPQALRTRAVFGGGERNSYFWNNGLAKRAERIVGLTGTPLPNRPREAYTMARGLNWESIDYLSQEGFLYRFNPSVRLASGHNMEVKGRLPELNARLRCNFMVRRRKKDVLKQLPDKRYEMTYIEPSGAISEVLAKEALIDFDPRDLFNPDFLLDGTPISTLRREMGEAMVPQVIEYMKYMFEIVEHEKLMLFAHHTSVIYALAEGLGKYGVSLHRGGMSSIAKDDARSDFVDGKNRLFIGQLDTMEGVDGLQHVCSDVVFAEPAWNPGRNEQCVDRAHRIGQHDNVVAHFLLVEGSFNEKVLNVVLEKAVDIHASLDRRLV
jgi:SNF2 family DNA or RNA helicase